MIDAHGTTGDRMLLFVQATRKIMSTALNHDTDYRVGARTVLVARYIGVADNQAPRPTVLFTTPSSRFLRTPS